MGLGYVKLGQPAPAAIRKLVLDPALAARMGAASRQKALAQFDERVVLTNTLAVYRELAPEWRSFHESEGF